MYKSILKPILFTMDAEFVHDVTTQIGSFFGSNLIGRKFFDLLFGYRHDAITQKVNNIVFDSPVGLAAGFDYNGYLASVLKHVGFGFNTVGTVTYRYYEGNKKPRLGRLPKSKSLLVNKGFKSEGSLKVLDRLSHMNLSQNNIGISIGSSNLPDITTLNLAINDVMQTFTLFKNQDYVKYYELNISCPNLKVKDMFTNVPAFTELLRAVFTLDIKKPIYVKMPNELDLDTTCDLVKTGIDMGVSGFIFANLVKDRSNKYLDQTELKKFENLKGNFSGLPTRENSDKLISHIYSKFGGQTTIIGCGGIFSAEDAYRKIKLGANLVQLITGMVYEGPFLIKTINKDLVTLLKKDGFDNISQAVGSAHKN